MKGKGSPGLRFTHVGQGVTWAGFYTCRSRGRLRRAGFYMCRVRGHLHRAGFTHVGQGVTWAGFYTCRARGHLHISGFYTFGAKGPETSYVGQDTTYTRKRATYVGLEIIIHNTRNRCKYSTSVDIQKRATKSYSLM